VSLPPVVEVAIELAIVYAAVSVFCSGVNEVLAEWVGRRGRFLREGLLNAIMDRWMYLRITTHPVVWSLYRDVPGKPRPPSYIPAATFTTAAFETILLKAAQLEGAGPGVTPAAPTFERLREALVRCRAAGYYLADALLPLVDAAGGDLAVARRNVEAWYKGTMDRVSGWYKRRTRWLLFVIGLAVAVLANVDTIEVVTALDRSATLRGAIAGRAEEAVRSGGLPVGFSCLTIEPGAGLGEMLSACWRNAAAEGAARWPLKALGWLLTAFAVSLGAPFWWQLLCRVADLRGAGRKPA
jgi:hypothetical protein